MSRSNPTDNATPNPSTRWFEWNGEHGNIRYYDKTLKKNIDVALPFTFVLLDQLGTVGGWHEPSQSAIYSNEVRDTRQDAMLVKSFKGGSIAEGLYKAIRDRVAVAGGHFVANCYIAYRNSDSMELGSIKFKGAALNAWVEFSKANRAVLYKKAIEITGFTEGKKGRVTYRVPQMRIKELSEASNAIAVDLDRELQTFLTGYLARTTRDQVDSPPIEPQHVEARAEYDDSLPVDHTIDNEIDNSPLTLDDIPF